MTDEEPEVDALEATDDSEPFDEAKARNALAKARREAANLRQRLKETEPLAARAREADEAAKSEAQKAAEARAVAERERDAARLELLRRDVAEAAGLPAGWAKRLTGSTQQELEADAKDLLKLIPAPPPAGRNVADLRSGALPPSDPAKTNVDDWIRRQAGR